MLGCMLGCIEVFEVGKIGDDVYQWKCWLFMANIMANVHQNYDPAAGSLSSNFGLASKRKFTLK